MCAKSQNLPSKCSSPLTSRMYPDLSSRDRPTSRVNCRLQTCLTNALRFLKLGVDLTKLGQISESVGVSSCRLKRWE